MTPYVVVLRRPNETNGLKLAFQATDPDDALAVGWKRALVDQPETVELQVWDFHETELLRHSLRPPDWDLLKRWEELRAMLREAQAGEREAADLHRERINRVDALDKQLTRLELTRSRDLALVFRRIAETYDAMVPDAHEATEVSGPPTDDGSLIEPLTFDDETKLGLGET